MAVQQNRKTPSKRGIGMVFQSYALYPQMSVEGNLSFGLRNARVPKEEIRERVDRARGDGDSLGGVFEVRAEGLPPGLGSYHSGPERLTARLGAALLSIPAIGGALGHGLMVLPLVYLLLRAEDAQHGARGGSNGRLPQPI